MEDHVDLINVFLNEVYSWSLVDTVLNHRVSQLHEMLDWVSDYKSF